MITNDIACYKTAKMRVNACYLAFIIKAVKRLFYYVFGSALVTFVTNKIKKDAVRELLNPFLAIIYMTVIETELKRKEKTHEISISDGRKGHVLR